MSITKIYRPSSTTQNESGWKWTSSTSVEDELAKHTTTKSIIPFSLNITGNQIGYWSEYMC